MTQLEQELAELQRQQAEIRQRLRQMRSGQAGIDKLQEKLERQLATAKWTVQQIHEIDGSWDDVGFYRSVRAQAPKPRGRRPRSAQPAE